ncbi:GNAT family N-acetyltransferase [Oceanidesulfovibrio marinus]|uniref:N-acetyltransferase n=1 Tax=Oceanidesulfovibrio marinus TaxID=370038 RepID=A0ABX6NKB7_9BACT|nr:GNAT family N-acetyltransferase [Oceanidesulfovibrio marinus]QJT11118.1 N-acetyltransferase [Oceanidesulfovibrio marinus]
MRHATIDDLPTIVAIYNSTVARRTSTADTEEVSVASKLEWFNSHNRETRPILVHEENGDVAAWVSFESFYGRPAYSHTTEISIYVDETCRGKGLGRRLLQEAISITPELGIKTILGYIFSHNEPSLRLFRSFGFEEWGQLPGIAEMDGNEYSLTIVGKRINP